MRLLLLPAACAAALLTGLAVRGRLPAYGAETPQQPYRWTCKAETFFKMKVTPDGVAHPTADPNPADPVQITIRERSQYSFGPIGAYQGGYVISLEGRSAGVFRFKGEDYYPSGARLHFASLADQPSQLDGVEAIYWASPATVESKPILLSLRRADKDWVFFVHWGDLMTDAEARRLSIQTGTSFDAAAEVLFLTGPCVRES